MSTRRGMRARHNLTKSAEKSENQPKDNADMDMAMILGGSPFAPRRVIGRRSILPKARTGHGLVGRPWMLGQPHSAEKRLASSGHGGRHRPGRFLGRRRGASLRPARIQNHNAGSGAPVFAEEVGRDSNWEKVDQICWARMDIISV